jgi:hypothetical protein
MGKVLIYRKFSADFFVGIPTTSKKKDGTWFVPLVFDEEESCAILNQLRVFDGRRLVERIGGIGDVQFGAVRIALHDLLFE